MTLLILGIGHSLYITLSLYYSLTYRFRSGLSYSMPFMMRSIHKGKVS